MKIKLIVLLTLFAVIGFAGRTDAMQMDTTAQKTGTDTAAVKRKTPEERAESLANRLRDKLELKDKQIKELKEIFMKREKALDSFWEQVRKSEDDMMEELKKSLSEKQFEKFKKEIYRRQVPQMPASPLKRDSLQSGPWPGKN
jgi:hypothetical protein